MKKIFLLGLFGSVSAGAKLIEKSISYNDGPVTMEGFLVYDQDSKTKQPGVLVVHDWMGLTDRTKDKARDLANLGYVAFAADIYGKGALPKDAKQAGGLAGSYKADRTLYRKRLGLALKSLEAAPTVDTTKLAAIGFCFGGTGVLELARSGAPVLGVVSFHGGLDSPDPTAAKNIKGKVLVLQGADDPFVPVKDWNAFEDEMRKNNVDWQLVKFGGAVHSFTDKSAGTDVSKGAAYNEKADRRSWMMMKDFFKELF